MPEETIKIFNHKVVRKTPIISGTTVVKLPNSMSSIALGSPGECDGMVIECSTHQSLMNGKFIPVCKVDWSNQRGATVEPADQLIAVDDVKYLASEVQPKYRVDQIVYVKPSVHTKPSQKNPVIGSDFETDVKILSYTTSILGNNITYRVYSPVCGYLNFKEEQLLSRNERSMYLYRDFKEGTVQVDLAPFFYVGERVKMFDGYVYSMDESVMVKINNELKKMIK